MVKHILIVDDDKHILRLLSEVLSKEKYIVLKSTSGKDAFKKIRTKKVDLLLLDIDMPEVSGFEVLEKIRKKKKYIATLFLTGRQKSHEVIQGLNLGADDYITKPFRVEEVMARVNAQFRIQEIRERLDRVNKQLKKRSITDPLTKLLNMEQADMKIESFLNTLSKNMPRTKSIKKTKCSKNRSLVGFGIFMIDLDHFKKVNDRHDHLFGSFVLSKVGKIIKENLPNRKSFAARFGGDEFCIVLNGTFHEVSRNIKNIKKLLQSFHYAQGSYSVRITSSMGGVFVNRLHAEQWGHCKSMACGERGDRPFYKEALFQADRLLYQCKRLGRNKILLKTLKI